MMHIYLQRTISNLHLEKGVEVTGESAATGNMRKKLTNSTKANKLTTTFFIIISPLPGFVKKMIRIRSINMDS